MIWTETQDEIKIIHTFAVTKIVEERVEEVVAKRDLTPESQTTYGQESNPTSKRRTLLIGENDSALVLFKFRQLTFSA